MAADLNSVTNLTFTVLLTCQVAGISVIIRDHLSFGPDPWLLDPSKHWGDSSPSPTRLQRQRVISGFFDAAGHASGTFSLDAVMHLDADDVTCSSKSTTWSAQ